MILKKLLYVRACTQKLVSDHFSIVPLTATIGAISLYFKCFFMIFLILIWGGLLGYRLFFRLFLPILALFYGILIFYVGKSDFKGKLKGEAHLHIQNMSYVSGSFGSHWQIKGVIYKFEATDGQKLRYLPFTLYLPPKKGPLLANSDYKVQGELIKKENYGYRLKLSKEAVFYKVAKSYSLAQLRYELKEKFKSYISRAIPFENAKTLLVGMATGDFQDAFLAFTFSRFGLNHLLAISGFHFALLAIFLNLIFKIFPNKMRLCSLAIMLTLFYLFVGYAPSLQRAWLVAMLYLWGSYKERLMTSINILSLAMLISLILNPFIMMHLGFQFSFLITFAILIYYPSCYTSLKKWLDPQSIIDRSIVKSLALGSAVHVGALPLCLYHFHKFYWLGFIFNLIIPTLISLILFGFMAALLLTLVWPSLAHYGLYGVGYVTELLIEGIYWIPTSVDYCLRVPAFSLELLQCYILIFILLGAYLQNKNNPLLIKENSVNN